jgi:hypothetical protein
MITRREMARMTFPLVAVFLAAMVRAVPSWAEQSTMEHVIVPASRGADFILGHYGTSMGPHWTPTEAQVREIEAGLHTFLGQAAPPRSRLHPCSFNMPVLADFA